MSLEALWYEVSPYVYFVVGLVSAAFSNSDFGLVFSALLLTASFAIFRLRRIYRRPDRVEFRKYSRACEPAQKQRAAFRLRRASEAAVTRAVRR